MLTKEYLHEIFTYRDGALYWKKCKNPYLNGTRAGSRHITHIYRSVSIVNKLIREHRIIWIMFNGEIPINNQIDHIDCDRDNNDISNLRLCTPSQNAQNKPARRNKTGYKGVSQTSKNSYHYVISAGRKLFRQAGFKSALSAYEARNKEVLRLHGDFSNFDLVNKK